jgi:hypothetical protein
MPLLHVRCFVWLYALLLFCNAGTGTAADLAHANRVLRDGAIAYGNAHFDRETRLVRRTDKGHHQLDVCQHSLEYAAALLAAGQQVDRANAVLAAVLDHQDVDPDSRTFGNFRWWHSDRRVRDRNAVAFMSPWLSHIAMDFGEQLTDENAARLQEALDRAVRGVRAHGSGPDYTNIWLLKAASLVLIGRALDRPGVTADGAERLDQWIEYTAENGISEYNSPCYAAVNIYAVEWIHHYAPDDALRNQAAGLLNYLYADAFQQWHWQAAIAAGTHSRAYEPDRDTGKSLVSCLVFKQCGQPLRLSLRSFLYVFAVNDYPVPEPIRAAARKQGMLPLDMRYTVLRGAEAVDCAVHVRPEFSLATQTGRRPVYNDRPLWDIPLKITYAGTKTERRATYISPKPTTKHATIASLQHGPAAIVLYEVDLSDGKLHQGRLRLNIEPDEGGMCEEILVDGRRYDRQPVKLRSGAVFGWRVADTLVALRLLDARGLVNDADSQSTREQQAGPTSYRLHPVSDEGLCLDCTLADRPNEAVKVDNLNCGFVLACATVEEHTSLAGFLERFARWELGQRGDLPQRQIRWHTDEARLQLNWDAAGNRVVSEAINDQSAGSSLRYDSPLIRLRDGEVPAVVPSATPCESADAPR